MRAFALLLLSAFLPSLAHAQAVPTADRSFRFSAFGAANGTWTGLNGGRNAGITAGLNVDLPSFRRWVPAVEARGTYPVKEGQVDSQKNFLGGLRVGTWVGARLFPYADVLFGRSQINYAAPGYQKPGTPVFYTVTSSTALAFGGGIEYRLTRDFSAKVDLQDIRQQTPVTDSGSLSSTQVNLGLTWRPHPGRRRGVSETD